jgi:hypothetical protein
MNVYKCTLLDRIKPEERTQYVTAENKHTAWDKLKQKFPYDRIEVDAKPVM